MSSLLDRVEDRTLTIFVGAHPDDETVIAPLLAWCADRGRALLLVSLTPGESGWNLHREDLSRTLADVRRAEFAASAAALGGEAIVYDYVNGTTRAHPEGLAVLDEEHAAVERWRSARQEDNSHDAIYARWTREAGDPAQRLLELFRQCQPNVIITFEPDHGVTGHPEHIAVSRATLAAARAHHRNAATPASLHYVHAPDRSLPNAERIETRALVRLTGKEYLAAAWASFACYPSQFRQEPEQSPHLRRGWFDRSVLTTVPCDASSLDR